CDLCQRAGAAVRAGLRPVQHVAQHAGPNRRRRRDLGDGQAGGALRRDPAVATGQQPVCYGSLEVRNAVTRLTTAPLTSWPVAGTTATSELKPRSERIWSKGVARSMRVLLT